MYMCPVLPMKGGGGGGVGQHGQFASGPQCIRGPMQTVPDLFN